MSLERKIVSIRNQSPNRMVEGSAVALCSHVPGERRFPRPSGSPTPHLLFVFFLFVSTFVRSESLQHVFTLDERAEASVEFVRISDGKTLFSHNASQTLIPASTVKLVLSAALLETLTPSFRMETRFYYTGEKKDGVISGDLIVVGDGDPFLVSEELFLIASDLRALGIRGFKGNLVIDNTLFDNQVWDKERLLGKDQTENAYHAPVTAFGVNFNTVVVNVSPGDKPGSPCLVGFDPLPLRDVTLENHANTSAKKTDLQVKRIATKTGAHLVVQGEMAERSSLTKFYRGVNDPVKIAGDYVRSFLKALEIEIHGTVREGRLDDKAQLLYVHKSRPIAELVKSLNLFSSNYMADVMLKRLAVHCCGQGSFSAGARFLEQYLRRKGVEGPFTLTNGSGLDEGVALSAKQLTSLLVQVSKDSRIFPEFLASLPVAGESGTLAHRFTSMPSDWNGSLRAKTGTLSSPVSVASLSGYFSHPKHGLVAFTVIQNGKKHHAPSVLSLRESQEKALASLITSI